MKKDDYKLGKILVTSAIVSDVPLGSPKPKRTKLKLVILAVILGYVGFAVYSNSADAQKATIEGELQEMFPPLTIEETLPPEPTPKPPALIPKVNKDDGLTEKFPNFLDATATALDGCLFAEKNGIELRRENDWDKSRSEANLLELRIFLSRHESIISNANGGYVLHYLAFIINENDELLVLCKEAYAYGTD